MAAVGKKIILLVEDETIIAMVEKTMLANQGFEVITVSTGEKAIETVNTMPGIDLILMDIDLGKGIDGTQAAAIILKNHRIPLVFLSSHTERAIVNKTEGITSFGYIVKNSGETVLITCINMAFKLFDAQKNIEAQKVDIQSAYEKMQRANEDLGNTIQALNATNAELEKSRQSLSKSEENYRRLVENSHDIIYTFTPNGIFTYVSLAWTELLGHSPDQVIGRPFQDFVHEDDVARCQEWSAELIETRTRRSGIEYRVRHADGTWRWHTSSAVPLRTPDGTIIGYEGIAQDITERKRAEEALQQGELNLKTIFDAIDESICLVAKDGTVLTANTTFARRLGREPDQCVGHSIYSLVPPEVANRRKAFVEKAFKTGEPQTFEDEREGHWIHQILYPIKNANGQTDRFVIYASDITKNRNAEKELHAAANYARNLIETSLDPLVTIDKLGKIRDVNFATERIAGKDRGVLIGTDFSECFTEPKLAQKAYRLAFERGTVIDYPLTVLNASGDTTDVLYNASVYRDENGEVQGVFAAARNISELKRFEDELAESENRFRSAFDFASIGMALVSPDGKWLKINRATCALLGYSEAELMAMTFQEITHPDDLAADLQSVGRMLNGEIETYGMEKRYIHKNGNPVWAFLSVSLVRDAQGRPSYFVSQIVDISAKKKAEKALKESEEKYRQIVTTAREGIWILDKDANTGFVNRYMADLLGYDEGEMQGKPLFDFMDAEAAKEARVLFERRSRDVSENHDFRFRRKDGSYIWVLIATNAILDENGAFVAALGMVTDITERKETEKNITRLLREKETLLRESHHRIKNNMGTLISLLSIQARSQANAEIRAGLETASGRIRAMMILYDKLYRADDTRQLGAQEFLPALVSEIVGIFPEVPPVSAGVESDVFSLDSKSMSVIGIIVNELITNSMKYAFRGRDAGRIFIQAKSRDEEIRLVYEDDGIGLPPEEKLKLATGFGMQLIELQVQQLEGTMRIVRNDGTRFEIRFPDPKREAHTQKQRKVDDSR